MPMYKISWTQPATVTATVSVGLDELAQWAIETDVLHGLVDGTAGRVSDPAVLRRALDRNSHLRDALLRIWVMLESDENASPAVRARQRL